MPTMQMAVFDRQVDGRVHQPPRTFQEGGISECKSIELDDNPDLRRRFEAIMTAAI